MMLKIQGYDISVKYVPGNKMFISDFLSRSYLPIVNKESDKFDEELNKEIVCHVQVSIDSLPISETKRNLIREETGKDQILQKLIEYIQVGWPSHKNSVSDLVKPFWNFRYDLEVVDGIIFKNKCHCYSCNFTKNDD